MSRFLSWSIRISGAIWGLCVFAIIILVGIATSWFHGTIQSTRFGNSEGFFITFTCLLGFGIITFGLLILFIIGKGLFEKKLIRLEKSFKSILSFPIKLLLLFAFLPIILLYRTTGFRELVIKIKKEGFKLSFLKPNFSKVFIKRLLKSILVLVTLLPIWIGGYVVIGSLTWSLLGYSTDEIPIAGTGSMYPTFPKGQGKTAKELSNEVVGTPGMLPYPNGIVLGGKRLLGNQISRGDIVLLINDKTKELTQKLYGEPSGWVKRVIGIEGDQIELRNGIVYLNNNPLEEPYTARARSTFGETFLSECKKIQVPKNSIFVMGDNRKASGDSREIGFISLNDVNHVIPLDRQRGILDKNWRNVSNDLNESSKIKLDKQKYLELLNKKRKENGVKLLTYEPKLEMSANKRGEIILKYNDFSFEATKSGYTMSRAMADSNYSNVTYGESMRMGYYDADELIENQFEFPEGKNFLLNKNYEEMGVAEVEGNLNDCPSQILVIHFAGYIPAVYKQSDIDSWKTTLIRLKEIFPSWATIKDYSLTYNNNKKDADRLLEIINYRIGMIERIINKMENKQWLSSEEDIFWDGEDLRLFNEQEDIAKKLNNIRWQH